ncbi:hypothetical protein B0I35DRAFT_425964 [Stachybotrys elegans]|uniref:Carboxymuconolactone decarboxylase-like domain-containing protein n=1 Tax=Stachybotrys elegans TaxID=80388 RepID=A0A8K0WTW6_9HYPO|nr:hypothetical protein B0I35DRAFT_425964 [Stachybotrys elegans]
MDSQPSDAKLSELFAGIEQRLGTTNLGPDRWYILAISCLVAGPDPEAAAPLYQHLVNQPQYSTSESRKALVRRLREALVKAIAVVGVCKPIEAILAISRVEREEDRDYSTTREGWQCDEENHERAMAWWNKIYAHNAKDTMGLFDAHKDFAWLTVEITSGFFLSDRHVLDDIDTELVVLSAIMSQNLPNETHWHIRGTRRIGVSNKDAKVLWDCIQAVAKHSGVSLHKVPTVDEVEPGV